jgi:hypothetical protein
MNLPLPRQSLATANQVHLVNQRWAGASWLGLQKG